MEKNEIEQLGVEIAMCLNMTLFGLIKITSKTEAKAMFDMIEHNLIDQGLNPHKVEETIKRMKGYEGRMRLLL